MPRKTIASLEAEIEQLNQVLSAQAERLKIAITERAQALENVRDLKTCVIHYKRCRDVLAGHLETRILRDELELKPIVKPPAYEGGELQVHPRKLSRPSEMSDEPTKAIEVSENNLVARQAVTNVPIDWTAF